MGRTCKATSGVILLLVASSAGAAPITLDLIGTIGAVTGSSSAGVTEFQTGDRFAYRVTLDDALLGPETGSAAASEELVSSFRAQLGSYRAGGSGGRIFLRNDSSTAVFADPYDQLSIEHRASSSDFDFGEAVAGELLNALILTVQHPEVEFVGANESLGDIAENIAASLGALQQPVPGSSSPTFQLSARFNNEPFGVIPVNVTATVESFDINPAFEVDPLGFGTAAAAIVKDERFDNATNTFSASLDGEASSAFALSTNAGSAAARAEITDADVNDGGIASPGLEVGVRASGAGEAGDTDARAIAFRSFRYDGDDPLRVNINSVLEGFFEEPRFELPQGAMSAEIGIYVFDALDFADTIDWLGGDLEEIFFPLRNKNTDQVRPDDLRSWSVPQLLGLDPLASLRFTQGSTGLDVFQELALQLDVVAGQSFTLLYDLAASSDVTCLGNECGAGTVDFFSSLSSAATLFTDLQGNAISSISSIARVGPVEVAEPPRWMLLLSIALLPLLSVRRRAAAPAPR